MKLTLDIEETAEEIKLMKEDKVLITFQTTQLGKELAELLLKTEHRGVLKHGMFPHEVHQQVETDLKEKVGGIPLRYYFNSPDVPEVFINRCLKALHIEVMKHVEPIV